MNIYKGKPKSGGWRKSEGNVVAGNLEGVSLIFELILPASWSLQGQQS